MINLQAPIIGEDGYQTFSSDYERNEDKSYKRDDKGNVVKVTIPTTLHTLVQGALLSHNGDTEPDDIELRYDIYLKIEGKDEVELTKEEVAVILELCCRKYDVLFSGQAIKLLKNV